MQEEELQDRKEKEGLLREMVSSLPAPFPAEDRPSDDTV